ncbi:SOS response-associated peptidase [Halorussus aquaticus]|uniref:SOS response-associated peptidase n=1 Tax=Halorussus aquaticus TaxID=2953748 RepID=A0ABD5Q2I8_9EURY|nr:SOS response-associated peptidase [Halorussus aquaticus]
MCGRTSLFAPPDLVADRFGAEPVRPLEPRYNVAPGQRHPVVRNDDTDAIRFPTWGLVPEWADGSPSSGHMNARAETLAEKPSFREAFAERRCLVLADGFYDWKETPTGTQPYRIERADRDPFAFAGLWEPRSDGSGTDATFTVVTTEPNATVEPIHHRMPVILNREEERRWLRGGDDGTDTEDLADLLDPYPASEMRAYPVSSAVNDPDNDDPSIIEEVAAEEDVQTGLDEF